jgi:hypothetical protein
MSEMYPSLVVLNTPPEALDEDEVALIRAKQLLDEARILVHAANVDTDLLGEFTSDILTASETLGRIFADEFFGE